ncbi:MAG: sigma-E factor negative regulatory protein, partial [Azoarcus sp.]|nr:sigma-E factor negative regulatory protein [Azoarcus sp.]
MREKLSLMLDGELDKGAAERVLDRLGADANLREDWLTWRLIGEAIRGETGEETNADSVDFTMKVMSRLEAEPIVFVPGILASSRSPVSSPPYLSSSSSWTRHLLPIAASVMGVLAVGGVVATLSPNER